MVHQSPHLLFSSEGWLQYHIEIANSFPDVNIIPYIKSTHVSVETIFQLIESAPNIGAVKYALEDSSKFGYLVSEAPRDITWICGVAEKWAPPFWSVTRASAFASGRVKYSPRMRS